MPLIPCSHLKRKVLEPYAYVFSPFCRQKKHTFPLWQFGSPVSKSAAQPFFFSHNSHVFIHGVFPVWTASCEFLIFCPCGHVWDVKWIWPKFLAADETGGKRLPVLRCILPFQGSKTSTDKTSGETVKWIPKKTYQSMMLFRKFSWGLRNHHGQASLGIFHHIFIGHGMLKSWVVSLDWTLNLQNCFASNPTPKKLQTMRDKEYCFFWKMLQSFHYPASCCGLGAQSIDVPLPGKLWEDQDSLSHRIHVWYIC